MHVGRGRRLRCGGGTGFVLGRCQGHNLVSLLQLVVLTAVGCKEISDDDPGVHGGRERLLDGGRVPRRTVVKGDGDGDKVLKRRVIRPVRLFFASASKVVAAPSVVFRARPLQRRPRCVCRWSPAGLFYQPMCVWLRVCLFFLAYSACSSACMFAAFWCSLAAAAHVTFALLKRVFASPSVFLAFGLFWPYRSGHVGHNGRKSSPRCRRCVARSRRGLARVPNPTVTGGFVCS